MITDNMYLDILYNFSYFFDCFRDFTNPTILPARIVTMLYPMLYKTIMTMPKKIFCFDEIMPRININTGVAHGELKIPLTAPIRNAPRLPLLLILPIMFEVGIKDVISLVSNAIKIIKMPRNMSQ